MAFTERSRASREAVLSAARQTFAERGYERTTVRVVAGAAGVDPSMVIRYFGSKDGLFAAAVDVDLRLPDLSTVPPDRRGDVLAAHFAELWEGSSTAEILVVLLRSATTNETAAERIRDVFAGQVLQLVVRLDDAGDADRSVRRRAGRIATHVLGTALTRYVLRLPPVAELSRAEMVTGLAPLLQAELVPAPESAPGSPP